MTLIVLLILAGVSLSAVFSEKGIFSRAEKAGNKYNEAKAREVLETVLLADGQYEKHTNPKYNQDDFLDELIKKEIEGIEIKGDVAIIDGWAFLLDRSVPKIGEPLGRAEGLVFPTVKVSEAKLAEDYRTSSFTVTAIEETNGINKIEIWLNGEKIKDLDKTYSNVKEEIEQEFTVNKNGVYTVKVYGKLMASEIVEVTGIVPAVEFTPNGNTDWKKEHQTKVTVKTNETITSMKYLWITSGTNPPEVSDFNNAELCTNNSTITGGNDTMTGTYYLWVLLTTQTGEIQKTNICGSEGFYFDNEVPVVGLTSTPISETEFKLITNATDLYSGIERYEYYINGTLVATKTPNDQETNYIHSLKEMGFKDCSVKVVDNAGNYATDYKQARTKMHWWSMYTVSFDTIYVPTGWGDPVIEVYTHNGIRNWQICQNEPTNSGTNNFWSASGGSVSGSNSIEGVLSLSWLNGGKDFYGYGRSISKKYVFVNYDSTSRKYTYNVYSNTLNSVKIPKKGTTYKGPIYSKSENDYPLEGANEDETIWYLYQGIG